MKDRKQQYVVPLRTGSLAKPARPRAVYRTTGLRRALALLLGLLCLIASVPAAAAGKVALLIGNSAYPGDADHPGKWAHLPNAKNDVRLVAEALRKIGFSVVTVSDASEARLQSAIDTFAAASASADVALFYYAGHGFEYDRHNYLVPVDAPVSVGMPDLPHRFVDFERAANRIAHAHTTIFMLDACRSGVPFVSVSTDDMKARLAGSTIDDYDFPLGAKVAVLYSTARGVPARDAAPPPTEYSPFAWEVAQLVTVPHVEITQLFNSIRKGVYDKTKVFSPPQAPYTYNSLDPDFFLVDKPASGVSVPLAKQLKPLAVDAAELATADDPILAVEVLSKHPVGELRALAHRNDPVATYLLGYMLENGIGTPADLPAARKVLEKAAALGTPEGQLEFAWLLHHHPSSPDDLKRALGLYRLAADQGFAKARVHYADALMGGKLAAPTAENIVLGLVQLRLAAAANNFQAMDTLALRGTAAERPQWKQRLETLSAQGSPDSHHWLCELETAAANFGSAMPHCMSAAIAGFADSEARVAIAAFKGTGRPRSIDDAHHWLLQALSRLELDPSLRAQLLSIRAAMPRS
jgi:TPR repeat protein